MNENLPKLPMNTTDIRQYLPHRYPMAYVDRVTHIALDESIQGFKNLTLNEPFFQGHFMAYPVMPGVIMVEALAQLAGILGFISIHKKPSDGEMFLFAGIDNARFKKQVVPGDRLDMDVKLKTVKHNVYVFDARASVDGQLVTSAELMLIQQKIQTL